MFKKTMSRFNLYFKNIPQGTTDEELRQFFSQFGEIKSLKQMHRKLDSGPTPDNTAAPVAEGEPLGFGFVSFSTIESATRARLECRTRPFSGSTLLTVCQFEPKATRTAHLEEQRDRKRLEFHKQLLQAHEPQP